jgi:hypothetical protein
MRNPSNPGGRIAQSLRRGARTGVAALCAAATLAMPTLAHAAAYDCVGKVHQVAVDPGGSVNATFVFPGGGMAWQTVCSLVDGTQGNVPTAACKGILALLMTAAQTQRNVQIWFDNASNGSCTMPAWKSLRDHGWYWGPSLINY